MALKIPFELGHGDLEHSRTPFLDALHSRMHERRVANSCNRPPITSFGI